MLKKEKVKLFWCYVTPGLLIYIVFLVIPFMMSFYTSMTDWAGYSLKMNFIGLRNYKAMLQDKLVWNAFEHNVYLFLMGAVFTFLLSVLFAVSLTKLKLKMKNFYRIVFFIPNILSIVIVSYVWMFIYNPSFGILNALLKGMGLSDLSRAWLGELDSVLPALAVPWIWMSVGFYMVLFIAAIENIPDTIYESAIIDGANQWQQTRKITLPLIWEIIRTSIVFFILNAFSGTFTIVNVTTEGGPARASDILTTYMYENAFRYSKFGYGTTIGVLIFLILLVLSMLMMKLTKRETIEY